MYANELKFSMSVVVSANWCIADCNDKINFASKVDKLFLKELMYGGQSDCFIVGRRTYETMLGSVKKPYIILSRSQHKLHKHKIFTDLNNLLTILNRYRLCNPLILGGNEIYTQFIRDKRFALTIYLVVETDAVVERGMKFNVAAKDLGLLMSETKLSQNTLLFTYKRGASL